MHVPRRIKQGSTHTYASTYIHTVHTLEYICTAMCGVVGGGSFN